MNKHKLKAKIQKLKIEKAQLEKQVDVLARAYLNHVDVRPKVKVSTWMDEERKRQQQ